MIGVVLCHVFNRHEPGPALLGWVNLGVCVRCGTLVKAALPAESGAAE